MKEKTSAAMPHNRLFVVGLAATWVVFPLRSADGCSCAGPAQVCYAYGEAAAVFVGRVISITPPQPMQPPTPQPNSGDLNAVRANRRANGSEMRIDFWSMVNRIRFEVEEVFSGEGASEIEVQTHTQSSACGRTLRQGERYLVYTHRMKKDGPLTTTSCDRTQLAVNAEEDLAFLRGLPPKGTGGRLEIALSQLGPDPQPFLPLAGIRIVAATEEHSVETITDATGRSYLEALPAGRYRVRAVLPDSLMEAYPPQEIQVNDGGCSRHSLFAKRKDD